MSLDSSPVLSPSAQPVAAKLQAVVVCAERTLRRSAGRVLIAAGRVSGRLRPCYFASVARRVLAGAPDVRRRMMCRRGSSHLGCSRSLSMPAVNGPAQSSGGTSCFLVLHELGVVLRREWSLLLEGTMPSLVSASSRGFCFPLAPRFSRLRATASVKRFTQATAGVKASRHMRCSAGGRCWVLWWH